MAALLQGNIDGSRAALVHQDLEGVPYKAAFQALGSQLCKGFHSLSRCVRFFLSWVRPLAFPCAELHEVPVVPFLHPSQVCLNGSTIISIYIGILAFLVG